MFLSFKEAATDLQFHFPIASIKRIMETENGYEISFTDGTDHFYDFPYDVTLTNLPALRDWKSDDTDWYHP